MTETPHCPVCGVVRIEPRTNVATTPWDSRCGCNDRETCWGHANGLSDWPAPSRPDDAEMLSRAEAQRALAVERWGEYREKFRRAAACAHACAGVSTEALEAGALAKALDSTAILFGSPLRTDDAQAAWDAIGAALRALGKIP